MDETDKQLWLDRITQLEDEVDKLKSRPKSINPFRWIIDKADLFIKFIGVPAAIIAALIQFDRSILNKDEFKRISDEVIAIEKIERLEDFNSEIFTLQVQEKNDVISAQIEAKKGRINRLTNDIYKYWEQYPDMYGYYEKVSLIGALNQKRENDKALAVLKSIDDSDLGLVELIDHLTLWARTYCLTSTPVSQI